ncbi:MAG: hypothetical protein HQK53_11730 [Oligoflexia bacterium]|nr:hypothetical protein [Oligoflexia bacterium]
MHRIDQDNFSTSNGLFTRGDIKKGIAPTVVSDDWLNDVQENLCQFIEKQGLNLTKGDGSQLGNAINNLLPQKNYCCPIRGGVSREILKQQVKENEWGPLFPANTSAIFGYVYGVRSTAAGGVSELGQLDVYRKFDRKWTRVYLRVKELGVELEVSESEEGVFFKYTTKNISIMGRDANCDGFLHLKLACFSV